MTDAPQIVWLAVWEDDDGMQAQAYTTEEGARRDFPGAGDEPSVVTIIRSTVQP